MAIIGEVFDYQENKLGAFRLEGGSLTVETECDCLKEFVRRVNEEGTRYMTGVCIEGGIGDGYVYRPLSEEGFCFLTSDARAEDFVFKQTAPNEASSA